MPFTFVIQCLFSNPSLKTYKKLSYRRDTALQLQSGSVVAKSGYDILPTITDLSSTTVA